MPWAIPQVSLQSGQSSIVTQVTVGTTPVQILAANPKRVRATIFYPDSTVLYLKLGPGAASNSFTYKLTSSDSKDVTDWDGVISAVKSSGSSVLTITEIS